MTLAGDETQVLYSGDSPQPLEKFLGIPIDISYMLTTSYRTSLQTALFANELLKGLDIKNEIKRIGFKGLKPVLKHCINNDLEIRYVVEKVQDLVKQEPHCSICIVIPKQRNLQKWLLKLRKE
jgi:hypothetical protein